MADSFSSGLGQNADTLGAYPSGATPLSVEELLRARAVSAPPPAAWQSAGPNASASSPLGMPQMPAAAQQPPRPAPGSVQGPVSAAAQQPSMAAPATGQPPQPGPARGPVSAAAAQPDARQYALRGLSTLQGNLDSATRAAGEVPTSDPTVDALERQREKLATPVPLKDAQGNILPQYKASLGQRVLRGLKSGAVGFFTGGIPGAVVGAIEPEAIRGGTAYGAPNKAYTTQEQQRQTQLAATDTNLSDSMARWKQAVDAAKAKAGEYRANASLGKDLTTGATDILKNDTTASKNAGLLRQHGLMTDAQGNTVPVPYEHMTPLQQAQLDLEQSKNDYEDAQTALRRAQNDPHSPAFKLAQQRANTAIANAQAAQKRASAYMGNYLGHYKGTDSQGNPLQGATLLDQTPVGSAFQSTVQKQQGKVAQFNDVLRATDSLESAARRLTASGKSLSDPIIVTGLSEPAGTFQKWLQGQIANRRMNSAQRDYVTNLRAFKENLQALRQSTGGGVSDAQVNRLMEMAPGQNTPDLDFLLQQTQKIRATAAALSEGIPDVVGGNKVRRPNQPAGLGAPGAPSGAGAPAAATSSSGRYSNTRRID